LSPREGIQFRKVSRGLRKAPIDRGKQDSCKSIGKRRIIENEVMHQKKKGNRKKNEFTEIRKASSRKLEYRGLVLKGRVERKKALSRKPGTHLQERAGAKRKKVTLL